MLHSRRFEYAIRAPARLVAWRADGDLVRPAEVAEATEAATPRIPDRG